MQSVTEIHNFRTNFIHAQEFLSTSGQSQVTEFTVQNTGSRVSVNIKVFPP